MILKTLSRTTGIKRKDFFNAEKKSRFFGTSALQLSVSHKDKRNVLMNRKARENFE